jgi:predicted nucleic-acid-binding protein
MDQEKNLLNQIFELEQKLEQESIFSKIERNLNRMKSIIEDNGFISKNPINEKYTDSRTDVEASIVGKESRHMIITKVVKPIIYKLESSHPLLVQKGIVIVESI